MEDKERFRQQCLIYQKDIIDIERDIVNTFVFIINCVCSFFNFRYLHKIILKLIK